ncbi:hypothetical protein ACFKJH_00730, partial [Streptococcus agalactiae]|uniref:hypothetical protein n=1 Tax=Streptococcus agalactiae TaxID=1311 RepID=UPI003643F9A3
NLFATTEASSRKQEQDRIVNYIKQHVELTNGDQIKKVEFIDFQKNEMTGTWGISTKINEQFSISFSEDRIGGKLRALGYQPILSSEKLIENCSLILVEIPHV